MNDSDLTLKEQLEILRGEPIQVFTGDPMDIPCIETSDPERLCKHPVVSVNMITYNHEPYIRQAIEGVMMQKTDFEFELVIGEDCSTDKTREICFEYQRRYPEKIRVLWAEKNLYSNPHPAGGNNRRNQAHCRGEFIAICEGDDYWIDSYKLQKQVDLMRHNPGVSFCFTGAKIQGMDGRLRDWDGSALSKGVISPQKYVLFSALGRNPYGFWGEEMFQMTATFLVRKAALLRAQQMYEIFQWRLRVGDGVLSIGTGAVGSAYFLTDQTSVYRLTRSGASFKNGEAGFVDTILLRIYYLSSVFGLDVVDITDRMRDELIIARCLSELHTRGTAVAVEYALSLDKIPDVQLRSLLHGCYLCRCAVACSKFVSLDVMLRVERMYRRYVAARNVPSRIVDLYSCFCPEYLPTEQVGHLIYWQGVREALSKFAKRILR